MKNSKKQEQQQQRARIEVRITFDVERLRAGTKMSPVWALRKTFEPFVDKHGNGGDEMMLDNGCEELRNDLREELEEQFFGVFFARRRKSDTHERLFATHQVAKNSLDIDVDWEHSSSSSSDDAQEKGTRS